MRRTHEKYRPATTRDIKGAVASAAIQAAMVVATVEDQPTMSEGITFDPIGTVTVTLDDKAYVLGRPKLRQFRQHRDHIRTLSATAMDRFTEMSEKLKSLKEGGPAFEKLTTEITEVSRNAFLLTSVPWLKSVFEDLGDPLPEDEDDWPAWLAADQTIPTQIIEHWRTVPLAPGAKGTN